MWKLFSSSMKLLFRGKTCRRMVSTTTTMTTTTTTTPKNKSSFTTRSLLHLSRDTHDNNNNYNNQQQQAQQQTQQQQVEDTSTTTTAAPPNQLDRAIFGTRMATKAVINPRVIFPWRHDVDPLSRLVYGTPEYYDNGGRFGPNVPYIPELQASVVTCFSAWFLCIPWYRIPFHGWQQELAESSSWAFTQAVSGVISNLYQIPFQDIRQEDGDFDLNVTHVITRDSLLPSSEQQQQQPTDTQDGNSPELDYMIESKLRELYQSAHECGRDQLQINLRMQPVHSKLVGAFVVPYLTRSDVQKDPDLRHTFRNMVLRMEQQDEETMLEEGRAMNTRDSARFAFREMQQLAKERIMIHDDHASLAMTVVAQVLISCDEIFSVTDLESGTVLQGQEDGNVRRVQHLVRLEAVLQQKKFYNQNGAPVTEIGPWQITDWDDLLEGNIWFL